MNQDTMTINGEEWVKKSSIAPAALEVNTDGLEYCIVRASSAGVFAGYVLQLNGDTATLLKARRLWYWDGAASLSELAMHGVAKPENCKFPCELAKVLVMGVIEVIPATKEAKASIDGVPVWTAR